MPSLSQLPKWTDAEVITELREMRMIGLDAHLLVLGEALARMLEKPLARMEITTAPFVANVSSMALAHSQYPKTIWINGQPAPARDVLDYVPPMPHEPTPFNPKGE